MNKSKFAVAMALALTVIASNRTLAMADDVAQKPDAAISATTAPAVKYDVDYMDEGIRVIIPKRLSAMTIKKDGTLRYLNAAKNYGHDLNLAVAEAYKSNGFEFSQTDFFVKGDVFSQTYAFSGKASKLAELNANYSKDSFIDGAKTWIGFAVRTGIGYTAGGAIAGQSGSLNGLQSGIIGGGYNIPMMYAKAAVFDGYQNLPASESDTIAIFGVTSHGDSEKGRVVFISEKSDINVAVIVRGIMRAQNIVAE